jgi:ankyrin repeat protein
VLDGKPNVNERTDDRWTALMMAASRGDSASIKVLIDAGADVNDKNKWGQTALMAAARVGDAEKVALLLQAGAEVNAQDADGLTALAFACTADGAIDSVKALIGSKADLSMTDNQGVTPLMRAADMGDAEKVAALLAAGARKDLKDRDGRLAIDWARQRDDDAGRGAAQLLD